MAAMTGQEDAPASVLDVDRGETLTLSREDFENAAAGPRDGRDDTYASIQSGLLGEDEAFGRATVRRLVVDGPEGSRVVVPAGAATADGVLEARGGVHVECHDPLQEVLLHDQATLEAPEGLRRLRALDESRADVDLTHAPDGYAVLLANESEGVLKGDAAGGNELVNEALKYPDYMGDDRPDQRVTGARGRVVGMDDADIVATDVPCVRLGSRFDDTPEDDPRLAQPTGAAFGRTGMILDGRAVADLYGASTAAVYGDAMAKAHAGTKAVAHQSGAVVPGDATGPFAEPFSRNAAKGSPDAPSDHTSADASDVRLLGHAAQDPTGRFRLSDPDAVPSPWPEADDIEIPREMDDSPVGAGDAGKVIDGFMTLRKGDDVSLKQEDFENAPLVRRYDDGTGPLVHELTVRGPWGSRVTVPADAAGDDCILNIEGGVEAECRDPYLETIVSGFATLNAPDGMYDLTALQNSVIFIDQAHVADGYAVLVADHATGVVDGGMREDGDLMERAREGDFGPFPSGQVVGLGRHAGIVATDVPAVHLWQGARGAAFGHTGMVLEQGSQADLYGRATAVARGSSQVRMQDDAKVLAMDGASVSAGDGLALHGASPWFDRSAASEYPRIRHHAPDTANVHLAGGAFLDAGGFSAASEAEDAVPARRRPSTAARIMAEAPAGADGPQDGLSR